MDEKEAEARPVMGTIFLVIKEPRIEVAGERKKKRITLKLKKVWLLTILFMIVHLIINYTFSLQFK